MSIEAIVLISVLALLIVMKIASKYYSKKKGP